MSECCCTKTKVRSVDEKKDLITRTNKIVGSLNGIKKMIEEDRYCDDILIQLSAVNSSIKSLANLVLKNHMNSCVINEINNGNTEIVNDVLELIKRFQ